MTATVALTDAQYREIGKRHASHDVNTEAQSVRKRWARDVEALAEYGHGPEALAEFEALLAEHAELRRNRSAAVAEKKTSIGERNSAVLDAQRWVDKVIAILAQKARSNPALSTELTLAKPASDAALDASIGRLVKLLEPRVAELPPSSKAAERLAEAEALRARLNDTSGEAETAKAKPQADTKEIDIADGKLYIAMRELNAAARKAIRNGDLEGDKNEYRFVELSDSRSSTAAPARPADKDPEKR